ncbi:hypothetical protein Ancab_030466 [Ancistrocladus abbreviatus]
MAKNPISTITTLRQNPISNCNPLRGIRNLSIPIQPDNTKRKTPETQNLKDLDENHQHQQQNRFTDDVEEVCRIIRTQTKMGKTFFSLISLRSDSSNQNFSTRC